jgi:hypothetical protein
LPPRDSRCCAVARMKRGRAPATPEEALKGLPLSPQQRAGLVQFMREFPDMQRKTEIAWLRPVSWSPKERSEWFAHAKAAFGDLILALDVSFRHDLFDAAKTKQEEKQVGKFLELLPVMAQLTGRITEQRIRERWAGADGRSARKMWTSIETDMVRAYVRHAGFCVYPPDVAALEALRRVLSFTSKTELSIGAVRKRIAADDRRLAAEAKRDEEDESIAV